MGKRFPLPKFSPRILSVIYFEFFINSTSDCFKTTQHCQENKVELYQIENLRHFLKKVAFSNSSTTVHSIQTLVSCVEFFWIYNFSRCFLNMGSLLNIFSTTVICMSLTLCPLVLKWTPVAFDWLLVFTYPLCSENLSLSVLSVSPIYCWGHFLHPNKYIILLEKQSALVVISFL